MLFLFRGGNMDNSKFLYKNKIKNRIFEIDLFRGVAVLFMIFDHLVYNFWDVLPMVFSDYPKNGTLTMKLFQWSWLYWGWDIRIIVRYIIVFIFLGLVGVCASFSKRNLKRGTQLMGLSLLLSLGSFVVAKVTSNFTMLIAFGTLHCIALSLIVIGLLDNLIKNKWAYLIIGVIMVGLGIYFEINSYVTSFGEENFFVILFKQIVGIAEAGGDTMAFLFNGGQVFIGVFIGKLLYSERRSIISEKYNDNIITMIGRNSLVIYFLHQIIIPIILSVFLLMAGYTLSI